MMMRRMSMSMRRRSGIVLILVKMYRVSRPDSARVRGSRAYIIHTGVSHVRFLATVQILAACSMTSIKLFTMLANPLAMAAVVVLKSRLPVPS